MAEPAADPIYRGISEFGELLAELLDAAPDSLGVVLSDGVDDTIDAARRTDRISELDLYITGAQIGQTLTRLTTDAIIFGLGRPQLVVEGERFMLITQQVFERYLITAVLEPRANITRAVRAFDAIVDRVLAMLR